MSYRYLSYPLTGGTPVYGGGEGIKIKRIGGGLRQGRANLYRIRMRNHCGTHIDAPNHFFHDGKKVADYPAQDWIFRQPQVIEVSLRPGQILQCGNWIKKIRSGVDILLFKSGWHKFRKNKKYILKNPGIHPEVGHCLKSTLPRLKAIGIDWVSVSSYLDRPLGREAHRAFLSSDGKRHPILIIEDMDLSGNLTGLKEVIVSPLRVKNIDSSPCTVLGRAD